jgi:hypothetical protein
MWHLSSIFQTNKQKKNVKSHIPFIHTLNSQSVSKKAFFIPPKKPFPSKSSQQPIKKFQLAQFFVAVKNKVLFFFSGFIIIHNTPQTLPFSSPRNKTSINRRNGRRGIMKPTLGTEETK